MRLRSSGPLALALLVLAAAPAAPQPRVWRIGVFHVGLDHEPPSLPTLRKELRALGYEEGRNLRLDWRNLPDEAAARETAKQFVRDRVDLIVAFESQTVRAAKAATTTIPIVFLHVPDPVAGGLVRSMANPGGNLTGFSGQGDAPAKEVEIFKELVPGLHRLAVLVDPQDPEQPRRLAEYHRAASLLKVTVVERPAGTPGDVEGAFAAMTRETVDGVIAASLITRVKFSTLMIRLALDKRLPLHVHRKEWVELGGLFTYAPDFGPVGVLGARYVDRILKGAKPAELPVDELTQFKLVINLKTAKTLGLTIPRQVLLRADEAIQ